MEYCVINAALGIACYVFPFTRRYIFVSLLVFGVICELTARRKLGLSRIRRADLRVLGKGVTIL